MPDAGWPETGFGNLVSFGSAVKTDRLFPFYFFAVYGFENAYFGTTVYPSTEEAKFVDDSAPPVEDLVTRFGTVRWYADGTSNCPMAGGGQEDSGEGDAEGLLDGDGESHWEHDRILVQLQPKLPMPPRGPVDQIGLAGLDELGRTAGLKSARRVIRLSDDRCARYPVGSRLIKLEFGPGIDERDMARRYAQLPEVEWASPNYAFPFEPLCPELDPQFCRQWPLVWTGDAQDCLNPSAADTCCEACNIGLDTAWSYSRGDSSVIIAFIDQGADMRHPDLFPAYMLNPHQGPDSTWEDRNGNGVADLCYGVGGDLDSLDNDGNGYVDDVLLGWRHGPLADYWNHPRNRHGTGVAGILGSLTNNGIGIASAAGGDWSLETPQPGVRLIQFTDVYDGYVHADNLYATFYYARDYGARIYSSSALILLVNEEEERIISGAIRELSPAMLFIQAAGNRDRTPMTAVLAKIEGVMAVGGYDCTGGRWRVPDEYQQSNREGSDYGPELSLLGPAGDGYLIDDYDRMVMTSSHATALPYSCDPNSADSSGCFGGTSAAAPSVAAVAGLVLSYRPDLSVSQLRMVLEHTAEDIQCDPDTMGLPGCNCSNPADTCLTHLLGWDSHTGYGRVDAGRALTLPVADLTLEPYADFVIWEGTVKFEWERLDLDPSNGGTPDHLELHYWIPDDHVGWVTIADTLSWDGPSNLEWAAPDSLSVGDNRYFRLRIVDSEGHALNEDYQRFSMLETTTAGEAAADAPRFAFRGLGPNPASSRIRVRYTLLAEQAVDIGLFDVAGRRIRTLARESQSPGPRELTWDCHDGAGHQVAGGIYFMRMVVGEHHRVERLVVVR